MASRRRRRRQRLVSFLRSSVFDFEGPNLNGVTGNERGILLVVSATEREVLKMSGASGTESWMRWERRLTEGYEATC